VPASQQKALDFFPRTEKEREKERQSQRERQRGRKTGMVVQAYNPSLSEGRARGILSLRSALEKLVRVCLKIKIKALEVWPKWQSACLPCSRASTEKKKTTTTTTKNPKVCRRSVQVI
jgi:hypothetical protein